MNDDSSVPQEETAAEVTPQSNREDSSSKNDGKRKLPRGPRVFGRWANWTLVVPFVVYLGGMMFGGYLDNLRVMLYIEQIDPTNHHEAMDNRPPGQESPEVEFDEEVEIRQWLPKHMSWYPTMYTVVIVATLACMLFASPGYFKIPFRISFLSFVVGVVGIFVWIGLYFLDKNMLGLGAMLSSGREAFNPFEKLAAHRTWMYQFLAIRFFGLVAIVPIVEEFFLRGFLMRYIDDPDWDEIPLGIAGRGALIGIIVYAVISHTGEPLAAAVWFGMVTWLYLRTRNIWDCVVAHAVTNLLLGIYIIQTGHWELW